ALATLTSTPEWGLTSLLRTHPGGVAFRLETPRVRAISKCGFCLKPIGYQAGFELFALPSAFRSFSDATRNSDF
ncbi:hypothetical protein, partial [Roseibium denhamense]